MSTDVIPAVSPQDPHDIARWSLGRRAKSLSQDEMEVMAKAFAEGIKTRPQARKLARVLGIPESQVAWWKGNQKIGKMVADILETKAIHGVAEVLPFVIERAKEDPSMFTALLRFAKLVNSGGVAVQVNVGDQRRGQEPEQVVAFINTFRDRQKMGLMRRLGPVEAEAEVVESTKTGSS
jgi:hypothetical protein